jgi:hypothetical protein
VVGWLVGWLGGWVGGWLGGWLVGWLGGVAQSTKGRAARLQGSRLTQGRAAPVVHCACPNPRARAARRGARRHKAPRHTHRRLSRKKAMSSGTKTGSTTGTAMDTSTSAPATIIPIWRASKSASGSCARAGAGGGGFYRLKQERASRARNKATSSVGRAFVMWGLSSQKAPRQHQKPRPGKGLKARHPSALNRLEHVLF